MSTTTLFVELLVIGFEACIWLVLLISTIVGSTKWLANAAVTFTDYAVLITAFVFGIAYVLGILIDKFAHWLLEESIFKQRLERSRSAAPTATLHQQMYAYVMVYAGEPMSDLLYGRSKVRILRASIINLPLITIAAVGLLIRVNAGHLGWPTVGIGLVLFALTVWAYVYNDQIYQRRLQLFYEIAKEKESATLSEQVRFRRSKDANE